MGAVVIDKAREREMIDWVRESSKIINLRQRPDLHFRDLSPSRKAAVCSHFAD
jgi:hypothetical protein